MIMAILSLVGGYVVYSNFYCGLIDYINDKPNRMQRAGGDPGTFIEMGARKPGERRWDIE
jgi:hypothetical protein